MSFPSLSRGAKSFQIEDAVNRILRWLNPLDTRGDLLVRGESDLEPLALGTNGQVLTSDGTDAKWADIPYPILTKFSNTLGANVALNNTASYFAGPSVAQGTSGIWLATGTVTVGNPTGAAFYGAKLWDGTTVISSSQGKVTAAGDTIAISLSGIATNPAGNLRISVRDFNQTTGSIFFNASLNSKDSVLSAVRIG